MFYNSLLKINKMILATLCIFHYFNSGIVQSMEETKTTKSTPSRGQTIERIWGLYKKYCNQLGQKELEIKRSYYNDNNLELHPYYDGSWGSCIDDLEILEKQINGGANYPSVLDKLEIDLSWEQIEEIFNKYGIIQLRKIDENSHKLLLGCGNKPINDFFQTRGHYHKGTTTVNPSLSMNPTIVASFGIDDLSNVLPSRQYDTLAFEYFGNMKKTDQLEKALDGEYFKENMDHSFYYNIDDAPCDEGRGNVVRDENGYDVMSPFDANTLFEKKGLPDTED